MGAGTTSGHTRFGSRPKNIRDGTLARTVSRCPGPEGRGYHLFEKAHAASSHGSVIENWLEGSVTIDGFAVNDASLKPLVKQYLTSLVERFPTLKVAASGSTVITAITGYTDSVGQIDLNMRLRKLRADSVAQHLVLMAGVHHEMIHAIGGAPMNEYLASNNTPKGRAQNRAVKIRIKQSSIRLNEAAENIRKLKGLLQQCIKINDKKIKNIRSWLKEPLTPGEKAQKKTWKKRTVEFLAEIGKHGRGGGDPTGGNLAEQLEYESDMEDWKERKEERQNRIDQLASENFKIRMLLSELNAQDANIRNGHIPDIQRLRKAANPLLKHGK